MEELKNGDNGYAKNFLDNFKGFFSDDDAKKEECYYNMEEIVGKWRDEFPDDANYLCAYVIFRIPDLTVDELVEYFRKVRYQRPVDAKHHTELLKFMTEVSLMKIDEGDIGEFMDRVKTSDGRNYAEEFKLALESNELGRVASIFNDWTDSGLFDSNYYYAKALIYSGTEGMTLDDAFAEFEKAKNFIPADKTLESWFKSVSWKFIKMKADEEGKLKTIYV